jgi:hypothetical protein
VNPSILEWQQWLILSVGGVLAAGILGYSAYYSRRSAVRRVWLAVAFSSVVAAAYSLICCAIQIIK